MAVHNGVNYNRAKGAEHTSTTIPAPNKGIDARSNLASMAMDSCVYSYNVVSSEEGLKVRPGYREWNIDVENVDTEGLGITTLISYTSATYSKLYAVSNEGIFDAATFDDGPWVGEALATFSTVNASAGHGVWVPYIDQSGEEWIFYADSVNGLYECKLSAGTWNTYGTDGGTGFTGGTVPTVGNINFIVHHKQRLWFIEEDAAKAWYLGVDAISGAPSQFYFGGKFRKGGDLVGLYNWSVDGGNGIDDFLVAISTGGDVLPYRGSDPTQPDWENKAAFNIGQVPLGGRIAAEYAGELYILSSYGIIAMSDLLRGVQIKDINQPGSLSFKIARLLRGEIRSKGDLRGWQIGFIPSLGTLVVNTPLGAGGNYIQYVMNLGVGGWGVWRGVPMVCFTEWERGLFFGSATGNIYAMDRDKDNITITDPALPDINGEDIDFSILTAFSTLNQPAHQKQVQFIRPDFIASGQPVFEVKPVYDYAISELMEVTGSDPDNNVDVWDTGTWDTTLWASAGENFAFNTVFGGGGMGRNVAVAMRGSTGWSTTFVSFDVVYSEGRSFGL